MPEFSKRSREILDTCDPLLIRLAEVAISRVDFSVISGHRGQEEQTKLLMEGRSHLGFPHSKHNKTPSMAFDVAPWPMDWALLDKYYKDEATKEERRKAREEIKRFVLLGGYLIGVSGIMGIKLRWGGDWNGNFDMTDQRFHDLPHFELL